MGQLECLLRPSQSQRQTAPSISTLQFGVEEHSHPASPTKYQNHQSVLESHALLVKEWTDILLDGWVSYLSSQ